MKGIIIASQIQEQIEYNTDKVERMADLISKNGTAIVATGLFFTLILMISAFLIFETKNEKKMDREERKRDREERAQINQLRMEREDLNNKKLFEFTERIIDSIARSNVIIAQVEHTLENTEQMHIELDKKVISINERLEKAIKEIEIVKEKIEDIQDDNEEYKRQITVLDRMEKALSDLIEHTKPNKEVD